MDFVNFRRVNSDIGEGFQGGIYGRMGMTTGCIKLEINIENFIFLTQATSQQIRLYFICESLQISILTFENIKWSSGSPLRQYT